MDYTWLNLKLLISNWYLNHNKITELVESDIFVKIVLPFNLVIISKAHRRAVYEYFIYEGAIVVKK